MIVIVKLLKLLYLIVRDISNVLHQKPSVLPKQLLSTASALALFPLTADKLKTLHLFATKIAEALFASAVQHLALWFVAS